MGEGRGERGEGRVVKRHEIAMLIPKCTAAICGDGEDEIVVGI